MLALLLSLTTFLPLSIIDGYVDKVSAFPADSIDLFLNANSKGVYDLMFYDLSGNVRHRVSVSVFPQLPANGKQYEDGFGYALTKRVAVPNLPSGIYLWNNTIPFVIKARTAEITVVYPVNTINAYNAAGGKSLYAFNSSDRTPAQKVSFLRPSSMSRHSEAFFIWLQKLGMKNVRYVTDIDLEDFNSIRNSRLLVIAGHSEYWTLGARRNFDKFVSEGKNALVLSGNTMWWQVRYNKSHTQMICYKSRDADPIKKPMLKTINWTDSMLNYSIVSSIGASFPHAGYGLKQDDGWNGYRIVTNSPLFAGTQLKVGDTLKLSSDETDGTPILNVTDSIPQIDYSELGSAQCEIIGFDRVSRGGKPGIATWVVFRPSNSSGVIINVASTNWCSESGIGTNPNIRIITQNMISKLLNNEAVFSGESQKISP